MNYNKIILSLVFISLNSFAMDTDKTLSLIYPANGTNSVEASPTSVTDINEDFLKLPKCLQRKLLGDEVVSTPAVVRFHRDRIVQNDNDIRHERYYPRQRNVSQRVSQVPVAVAVYEPVAIARPVQEERDPVDTLCALVSQCLGMNS